MTTPTSVSDVLAAVPSASAGSAVFGAFAWHLVRPYAQPTIDKALAAFPAWLASRAKDRFKAALAGGKVPPQALSLLRALYRATFAWADQELSTGSDADKVAAIAAGLAALPGIGKLVAADPEGVKREIAIELAAVKAEVAKDAAAPK